MPPLTPGDAQDLLASFKRGWESRDPEAVLSLFDEHAEYREDPFSASPAGTGPTPDAERASECASAAS